MMALKKPAETPAPVPKPARPALFLRSKAPLLAVAATALWTGLVAIRSVPEMRHAEKSRLNKLVVGTRWDPRGFMDMDRAEKARESESFRDRLRRGQGALLAWPGLASAQVAWTWLELLQGMHHPSSYEGDFSWMFSKLDTIIQNSPPGEVRFLSGLAPFFMVMGHDYVGANILMQQLITRGKDEYTAWFWSGWHAMDNLKMKNLAADLFEHAATFPWAPPYLAVLALRLKDEGRFTGNREFASLLERELPEKVLDKVKKARPDLFKDSK